MTRKSWKKALVEKTKEEGTYKPSFDIAIDILSEILEERDKVYKLYLEDGSRPVVDVTTDRGQTNKRPNPLLNQYKDLNGLQQQKKQITGSNSKTEFWLRQKQFDVWQVVASDDVKIVNIVLKGKGKKKLAAGETGNIKFSGGKHFDFTMFLVVGGILGGMGLLLGGAWRQELKAKMPMLMNVEFLRIFFTIGIVCNHFFVWLDIKNVGFYGVEFFFILSGYFLLFTYRPDKSLFEFIKQKFVRFVPLTIFGCMLMGSFSWIKGVFFLQNTGLVFGFIADVPAWYLGVLFWVLLFYRGMLQCFDRKVCNFLIGVISFVTCVVCVQGGGDVENLLLGYFPHALLRGVACVGMGCLLAGVCIRSNESLFKNRWYSLFEACVLVWCMVSIFVPFSFMNSMVLFCISQIAVLWLFIRKRGCVSRFFEKPWCVIMSRYCLSVYLTHWAITSKLTTFFSRCVLHTFCTSA